MKSVWKDLILLALAALIAPVMAAAFAAMILAMVIAPDLIFRVDINSIDSRPATLREIATNLGDFGIVGVRLGAIPGWPAMVVLGLPLHGWLFHNGKTDGVSYALSGIAAGFVTVLLYLLGTGDWWVSPSAWFEAWPILLTGSTTGLLAAGLFWLIRRPDRMV